MDEISAFPLTWPAGRPRTAADVRSASPFGAVRVGSYTSGTTYKTRAGLTLAEGRDRLLAELKRLDAGDVVISSNVELRRDGLPYSGRPEPKDPGVAVYFKIRGAPRALACDKWTVVADNLAAIAKTVEAQRGMVRWGAVTAEQIFEGFKALPAPGQTSNDVCTVEEAAEFIAGAFGGDEQYRASVLDSRPVYEDGRRVALHKFHPDRNGGEPTPDWHKLQSALTLLDKHHGRSS